MADREPTLADIGAMEARDLAESAHEEALWSGAYQSLNDASHAMQAAVAAGDLAAAGAAERRMVMALRKIVANDATLARAAVCILMTTANPKHKAQGRQLAALAVRAEAAVTSDETTPDELIRLSEELAAANVAASDTGMDIVIDDYYRDQLGY